MNVFQNLSEFVPANTSVPDNVTLVQCPLKMPLLSWDLSSFNQSARVSTILAIIVNIITMPFTVFFNAVVIIVVWKNPCLQVERVVVLAYLALTDFLIGLICFPLFITREALLVKTDIINCELSTAYHFFLLLLLSLATQELVLVTYERYVAIIHSLQYPTRITVRRLTCAVLGIWALNTSLALLHFVLSATDAPVWYIKLFRVGTGITAMIFMVYWYIWIFLAIRRQNHQISQQQQNINMDNPSQTLPKHKGVMTAALLLVSFLVSFAPALIMALVKEVLRLSWSGSVFVSLRPWPMTFIHLGSLINPIIYGLRVRELRRKCWQLFGFNFNNVSQQNTE